MTLEETWDYKGHLIKRKSRRLKQVSTWYPSHCYKILKRSLLIRLPLWEGFQDYSQHVWTLPCLLPLSYIWLSSDRCRHTPWASGFDLDLMIVMTEFRIGWLSAAPPSIALALVSRQGLCPSFYMHRITSSKGSVSFEVLSPNIHISCLFCVPQKQTRPDFCNMAWMSDEWEKKLLMWWLTNWFP